ncbi:MAG: hypothetical protein P8Y48_13780 [Novosphingobium sp.]
MPTPNGTSVTTMISAQTQLAGEFQRAEAGDQSFIGFHIVDRGAHVLPGKAPAHEARRQQRADQPPPQIALDTDGLALSGQRGHALRPGAQHAAQDKACQQPGHGCRKPALRRPSAQQQRKAAGEQHGPCRVGQPPHRCGIELTPGTSRKRDRICCNTMR